MDIKYIDSGCQHCYVKSRRDVSHYAQNDRHDLNVHRIRCSPLSKIFTFMHNIEWAFTITLRHLIGIGSDKPGFEHSHQYVSRINHTYQHKNN